MGMFEPGVGLLGRIMGKDGLQGWAERAGNYCREDSGLWGICLLAYHLWKGYKRDFNNKMKPANQLIIGTQQAQQHVIIHDDNSYSSCLSVWKGPFGSQKVPEIMVLEIHVWGTLRVCSLRLLMKTMDKPPLSLSCFGDLGLLTAKLPAQHLSGVLVLGKYERNLLYWVILSNLRSVVMGKMKNRSISPVPYGLDNISPT